MKINLLQYSFILFPIGGQSEFNRAILFIYYFSFKEITIHVHFWPTSHIHSLFLDLQSFVTQNHQHGSYACSWVCHFHWVLTNRIKKFFFQQGYFRFCFTLQTNCAIRKFSQRTSSFSIWYLSIFLSGWN